MLAARRAVHAGHTVRPWQVKPLAQLLAALVAPHRDEASCHVAAGDGGVEFLHQGGGQAPQLFGLREEGAQAFLHGALEDREPSRHILPEVSLASAHHAAPLCLLPCRVQS